MSNNPNFLRESYSTQQATKLVKPMWQRFHIDQPLLVGLLFLIGMGLFILYSAENQNMGLVVRQGISIGIAFVVMVIFAQIPPRRYCQWVPWIFGIGMLLLVAVLAVGHIGKGGQRWLSVSFLRFQPSEIMKLAMPMMLAWFLDKRPLPPSILSLLVCAVILTVPVLLIAKEPDLGTALVVAFTGVCVVLLSGVRWYMIFGVLLLAVASTPIIWPHLHDYQRQRVLTFLNPERDPLNAGYHIIQSKIAVGSGGLFGKGYLHGTQSHLQFLPEHATDFIFAVCGEELGLMGSVALIVLMLFVVLRGLYISTEAQDTFSRLLAGSLSLTFFLSFFVNVGMVTGILPVVGLPLPLVSYGGSSMVTILAGFGIIMSIHTHRNLLTR